MEVRNTSPENPIGSWSDKDLLHALGVALRDTAVHERDSLSPNERMRAAIQRVQIFRELLYRHVDLSASLNELSENTLWRMDELLQDCLAWPDRIPRARNRDGILRHRRCNLCRAREYPDPGEVPFCDDCVRRIMAAITSRSPIEHVFLYRTFNPSYWCAHADSDTMLANLETYDLHRNSFCLKCFASEVDRRDKARESRIP